MSAGAPCVEDSDCPTPLVCSEGTRRCAYESVPADAAVDAEPTLDAPAAIRYRRQITIVNSSPVPLPAGYTIRVAMPAALGVMRTERKVKEDFSDLHVIGRSPIGERDRIVDRGDGAVPGAVSFSLKDPIAPGTTSADYALYYGGEDAAPALARGSEAFALYDDFAAGISTTWLRNDGPVTTTDGKLVLRAGHTDALTTVAASDKVPTISAVEIAARVVDPAGTPTPSGSELFYYWFGYQRTGDFTASQPWALWVARAKSQIRAEQKSPVGCETACEGPVAPQSNAVHYYVIERDPTATRFYLDGVLSYTAAVLNEADYSIMVRNYMLTSDVEIDWIRARARVSPDPTVTLDAEQPQ